jgi:hypothetical protein
MGKKNLSEIAGERSRPAGFAPFHRLGIEIPVNEVCAVVQYPETHLKAVSTSSRGKRAIASKETVDCIDL